MKKIYLAAVIFVTSLTLNSCGSYKAVTLESPDVKVKNVTNTADKNSNYIKANEWMVETFNNATSVIQFSDKEGGIVKGKYVMKVGVVSSSPYAASTPDFYALITIRVKDSVSRIEVTPPTGMYSLISFGVELGFTPKMFDESAEGLISKFETRMKSETANKNW
jgi:hypothetical protein